MENGLYENEVLKGPEGSADVVSTCPDCTSASRFSIFLHPSQERVQGDREGGATQRASAQHHLLCKISSRDERAIIAMIITLLRSNTVGTEIRVRGLR